MSTLYFRLVGGPNSSIRLLARTASRVAAGHRRLVLVVERAQRGYDPHQPNSGEEIMDDRESHKAMDWATIEAQENFDKLVDVFSMSGMPESEVRDFLYHIWREGWHGGFNFGRFWDGDSWKNS